MIITKGFLGSLLLENGAKIPGPKDLKEQISALEKSYSDAYLTFIPIKDTFRLNPRDCKKSSVASV
jgi:hypothetical protein